MVGSKGGKIDFESVYLENYDRIYKYAYTLLLNKEDAEDVTSETFILAYTNFASYDSGKASVRTWLTHIVHNRAVNLVKSADRKNRREMPEGYDEPHAEDDHSAVELSDTVKRLYSMLTREEREFLNLRCVMELRDAEVAALLRLPEKTVNKRYQRLLAKCRELLSGAGSENIF